MSLYGTEWRERGFRLCVFNSQLASIYIRYVQKYNMGIKKTTCLCSSSIIFDRRVRRMTRAVSLLVDSPEPEFLNF
jgi:hypothetical protein